MKSFFEKINIRKILSVSAWILLISGLFVTLAFVNQQEKLITAKKTNINVDYSDNNQFIDATDIKDFLKSRNDVIDNKKISDIDINKIEKSLLSHPAILSAQVSVSIDGNMKINIKQKDPLVRIFNLSGESYYIDKQSKLMPLSDNYTAKVIVASGHIWEPFASNQKFNFAEIYTNKSLSGIFVLDDIFTMSNLIKNDTFLNSMIHQIYVNEKKEFELLPAVGEQKIIFGKSDNMERKFAKLKLFYKEGLNSIDGWNNYSTIDLRFEGQVVCKKKILPEQNKKTISQPEIANKTKPKHEAN